MYVDVTECVGHCDEEVVGRHSVVACTEVGGAGGERTEVVEEERRTLRN